MLDADRIHQPMTKSNGMDHTDAPQHTGKALTEAQRDNGIILSKEEMHGHASAADLPGKHPEVGEHAAIREPAIIDLLAFFTGIQMDMDKPVELVGQQPDPVQYPCCPEQPGWIANDGTVKSTARSSAAGKHIQPVALKPVGGQKQHPIYPVSQRKTGHHSHPPPHAVTQQAEAIYLPLLKQSQNEETPFLLPERITKKPVGRKHTPAMSKEVNTDHALSPAEQGKKNFKISSCAAKSVKAEPSHRTITIYAVLHRKPTVGYHALHAHKVRATGRRP